MKKIIKNIIFLTLLLVAGLTSSFSLEENSESTLKMDSLVTSLHSIWPDGNCAANISESKSYSQITYACNDNYTAHQRNIFLDNILKYGWSLKKETYRIDKNSASYFYKFASNDKNLYVKLFFRNPLVIWPLHENHRPKIAIFLNNVKNPDELERWQNLKLPLSISISILENDYGKIIERARQTSYDAWVLYSGNLDPLLPSGGDLEKLSLEFKKIPDENFPFSGLTLPFSSGIIKDTQSLRLLLNTMKKNGLQKFLAPPTLEVIDTSRILGVTSITAVFNLSGINNDKKAIWKDAYGFAQKHGYSVITLNSNDTESMNFLLKMMEDTLGFVDYVNLSRLPIQENLLNGQ